MAKQVKRSVMPIYLVGVTWLVCALFFSLRSMTDYLLCAAVSAGVFIAGKAVFPDRTYTLPDEQKAEKKQPEKLRKRNAKQKEKKPSWQLNEKNRKRLLKQIRDCKIQKKLPS